jgi:3-oxoacyl-[acyl-carrier protein] reductase
MDLGISGRRAAVAASSGGLGLATAQALAADGVRVAICGRDQARLDAAVDSIRTAGGDVVGIRADVATMDGGRAFVEQAAKALGGIDILVANAGGPPAGGFADTRTNEYAKAFELNALSTVGMCEAAVPAMRAARWGRVLAITSATVRQPTPKLMLSTMARAGATGFLKSLALEVAVDGVTVNSIQPGSHDTERLRSLYGGDLGTAAADVPMGHVGDAADFGRVAAFLCSESARFITGAAIPVDGGRWDGLQ